MPIHRDWQPSPNLWKKLKPLARQIRKEPTIAETKLWQHLHGEQIRGVKFRRQFALDRFIADFCSPAISLIIKVNGPIHQYTLAEDAIGQTFFESLGFEVIRFDNLAVLNTIQSVLEQVDAVVLRHLASACSPLPLLSTQRG